MFFGLSQIKMNVYIVRGRIRLAFNEFDAGNQNNSSKKLICVKTVFHFTSFHYFIFFFSQFEFIPQKHKSQTTNYLGIFSAINWTISYGQFINYFWNVSVSLFCLVRFCGSQNSYLLVSNFIKWVHTCSMFNYSPFDNFDGVQTIIR